MIRSPIKIQTALDEAKNQTNFFFSNQSQELNKEFENRTFTTLSNDYSVPGNVNVTTDLEGEDLIGSSLDSNTFENNIQFDPDVGRSSFDFSDRYGDRLGIPEPSQTEFLFAGPLSFVDFNLYDQNETTNLISLSSESLNNIFNNSLEIIPENVARYYFQFTNNSINDIQHLSFLNPKLKEIDNIIFNKIRQINLSMTNNFYASIALKSSKLFSKIPSIVGFVDNKITNVYNKIVDFNDKASLSLSKINNFYLKNNYSNTIESFLVNDTKNKSYIGKIFDEASKIVYIVNNENKYQKRQNDNLQAIQDKEIDISRYVSNDLTNIGRLILSDFENENSEVLDTDSFIAQQFINLSCSFFTIYPSLYCKINNTINNTNFYEPVLTQKLNSKYSKVCINPSELYRKNIFSYINENSNNIDKGLIEDTSESTFNINKWNTGIEKNLNFDIDLEDIEYSNDIVNPNNINAVNLISNEAGRIENVYHERSLLINSKVAVANDISREIFIDSINNSDNVFDKFSYYFSRNIFLNLFDTSLGLESKSILNKDNFLILKNVGFIADENFDRSFTSSYLRNRFFSDFSNPKYNFFTYLFLQDSFLFFNQVGKFDKNSYLTLRETLIFKEYISEFLDNNIAELVDEFLYSRSSLVDLEFILNNYYWTYTGVRNNTINDFNEREKIEHVISEFRHNLIGDSVNGNLRWSETDFFDLVYTDTEFETLFDFDEFVYIRESNTIYFSNRENLSTRIVNSTINEHRALAIKVFMTIEFMKFFIYFINKKTRNKFTNYTKSVKSLINHLKTFQEGQQSSQAEDIQQISLINILKFNFFQLNGIMSNDIPLKTKNSLIVKKLWGSTESILQNYSNREYDYLSKSNLILNSNKFFIHNDSLIKSFKLDLLKKQNVDMSMFKNIVKSIKSKNNSKYLVTYSNENNSDVFSHKEDKFFNLIFKSEEEKSYSYFSFCNNAIQKDMDIYNTSHLINLGLDNEEFNEKLNNFHNIVKNYFLNNVFGNTTTLMKCILKNISEYFDLNTLDKNELVIQYLYFCCFEDNIETDQKNRPINKESIVKRFYKKALSQRSESSSSLASGKLGYFFDQSSLNRADFESDSEYNKEVLNTNEEYKKIIDSIFTFNKNIAKSVEIFRLYNLRTYRNFGTTEGITIDNVNTNSVIDGTILNNIIDVSYYTFPFKKFNRDFLFTYFDNRSYKDSINIVKRFDTTVKNNIPSLEISEEYKELYRIDIDANTVVGFFENEVANISKESHSKIIDDFDDICTKENTIFNHIIKKINLIIDYLCDIEETNFSNIEDIEDFISNNSFIENYIAKILESYSELYNIAFRRLEINSYNKEINSDCDYELSSDNNYLFENEVSEDLLRSPETFESLYGLKNISDIEIKRLSGQMYNHRIDQNKLFEKGINEIYSTNSQNRLDTNSFINNQINLANTSDQLQAFSLDLINGFFIKQKEFYENRLDLQFDFFETNQIIDEFNLDRSLYTNLSKKSFLINMIEKINSEVYNKKTLYKKFIVNKQDNDLNEYYIDKSDLFFENLKNDQAFLTKIIDHKSNNDFKKSILSITIPNNLVDKIDNNQGINLNIRYIPHKDLDQDRDTDQHLVYEEYNKTFIPIIRNLNNLHYKSDDNKNYNNDYVSIFNEKEILTKKYTILNSNNINNNNLKEIAFNHLESNRFSSIYNVFYNNNLSNNIFYSKEFYNDRVIDLDLYNFIINLRDRDFNLISKTTKENFISNVEIINEKYVKIPSRLFCIENKIYIYDILFEINKNTSIVEYEKAFIEKEIFDMYFVPLSENFDIDGKTFYTSFSILNNIL